MSLITCTPDRRDPFRCPTKWEIWSQIMALLPRGRAWQSHEDVIAAWHPPDSQVGVYEVGDTGLDTGDMPPRTLTIMQSYWAAYAEVLEHLHQRACRLLAEFTCATTVEMLPEWWVEYGFPDVCQPYDTLCDKVAAQGGATCAYLQDVAARRGWAIECVDDCNWRADCAPADIAIAAGPVTRPILRIRLLLADSPAAAQFTPFEADALVADCTAPCVAVPDELFCLIETIRPAHVAVYYEVV